MAPRDREGVSANDDRATSPVVIAREGGRASIPETAVMESRSRGVLGPPPSRGMTTVGGGDPCVQYLAPRHTLFSFSRRLRRLQSQLRFHRIAHQKLLDLPRHRHRKLVDEFDVARDLVVGDLAVAEGADVLRGERLARPGADPGAELL